MDDRPIGMFDSGFGGLTVARAVIDLLPDEHLVYIGDTGRYPYGPRAQDELRGFAHQITGHLVAHHDVKLVVVACNTAASAAPLAELEAQVGVPVVGVIEPGARSLVTATRSGRVGVIGTVGTIASGAYHRAVRAVAAAGRSGPSRDGDGAGPGGGAGRPVQLTCAACPGFVEFVEKGETASDQVHVLAERLLAPVRDAKVDALLLGCTHYPFLARTIADVMGRDVVLVSSADETAFEVRRLLLATGLARRREPGDGPARHRWLSSGDVAWFRQLGRRLLGPELAAAEPVAWPELAAAEPIAWPENPSDPSPPATDPATRGGPGSGGPP
jgi:glutamate racemase